MATFLVTVITLIVAAILAFLIGYQFKEQKIEIQINSK